MKPEWKRQYSHASGHNIPFSVSGSTVYIEQRLVRWSTEYAAHCLSPCQPCDSLPRLSLSVVQRNCHSFMPISHETDDNYFQDTTNLLFSSLHYQPIPSTEMWFILIVSLDSIGRAFVNHGGSSVNMLEWPRNGLKKSTQLRQVTKPVRGKRLLTKRRQDFANIA